MSIIPNHLQFDINTWFDIRGWLQIKIHYDPKWDLMYRICVNIQGVRWDETNVVETGHSY